MRNVYLSRFYFMFTYYVYASSVYYLSGGEVAGWLERPPVRTLPSSVTHIVAAGSV